MISSLLSQQAREDFDIVLKMAQSIGLADHPPRPSTCQQYIANSPIKKKHKRRCNHSDLLHIQREQRAKKVRERHSSLCDRSQSQQKSARKGSVNDVYCNAVKPYEDPIKYFQTQKVILKNDMARLTNMSRNSDRVKLMSRDKQRRSKILGDISDGVITVKENETTRRYTSPLNFFRTTKTKVITPRTVSQEKIVASFDYSKFKVVPRLGCLGHLSRESNRPRQIQTARNGKRSVNVHFNQNNKVELVFNHTEESRAWFQCS